MLRHCRHFGEQKQYIFSPLGNNIYFHAKLFHCFSAPSWLPWKPSILKAWGYASGVPLLPVKRDWCAHYSYYYFYWGTGNNVTSTEHLLLWVMCGFLLNLVQIYNNTYTTENCLFKNYRLIKVPAKIHEILNRIYTQENHLNNTNTTTNKPRSRFTIHR